MTMPSLVNQLGRMASSELNRFIESSYAPALLRYHLSVVPPFTYLLPYLLCMHRTIWRCEFQGGFRSSLAVPVESEHRSMFVDADWRIADAYA